MSGQEPSGNPTPADSTDKREDQSNDELASKLSKELSNWRRRRTSARPRPSDIMGSGKAQSEPARTIKVRGHETLVIRKSKLAIKPRPEPSS